MIDAVNMSTGERTRLIENARMARYIPAGYLLYVRGTIIYAVRFSLETLKVTGDPFQVFDDFFGEGFGFFDPSSQPARRL